MVEVSPWTCSRNEDCVPGHLVSCDPLQTSSVNRELRGMPVQRVAEALQILDLDVWSLTAEVKHLFQRVHILNRVGVSSTERVLLDAECAETLVVRRWTRREKETCILDGMESDVIVSQYKTTGFGMKLLIDELQLVCVVQYHQFIVL
jgi:hypothetical protein